MRKKGEECNTRVGGQRRKADIIGERYTGEIGEHKDNRTSSSSLTNQGNMQPESSRKPDGGTCADPSTLLEYCSYQGKISLPMTRNRVTGKKMQ
jgi:hypothetical protein